MTICLTTHDCERLRREPLRPGERNRLKYALSLTGSTAAHLSKATGISLAQLYRYINGGDLLMSTASRIAKEIGCDVVDLWPVPPTAKARRVKKAQATSSARAPRKSTPGPKSKASVAA